MGPIAFDLYWQSGQGRGRELLLEKVVQIACERNWLGDFHCHWDPCDVMLVGDNWHGIEIRSATEELGEGRRFTRVRARLRATGVALSAVAAPTLWSALAVWQDVHWAQWIAIIACALLAGRLLLSRRHCRRAVASLLASAARRAALDPVVIEPAGDVETTGPDADPDRRSARAGA
jgi:hypothetical protein